MSLRTRGRRFAVYQDVGEGTGKKVREAVNFIGFIEVNRIQSDNGDAYLGYEVIAYEVANQCRPILMEVFFQTDRDNVHSNPMSKEYINEGHQLLLSYKTDTELLIFMDGIFKRGTEQRPVKFTFTDEENLKSVTSDVFRIEEVTLK